MATWFITGISRGFGKIMTEELLRQGHVVVGTTRNGASDVQHKNLHVVKLDVTDAAQVQEALKTAVGLVSKIDVVVNNAGFGIVGAIEEVSRAEISKVYETNVFGTLNVIHAALPYMRKQKSGSIVNLSSVGGFVSMPGFGVYCSSKFAVEALSEALSGEVKPLGIHVMIVEPGSFRTDFLSGDSILRTEKVIDDYKGTSGETRNYVEARNGKQPGNPELGVKVIIDAVLSKNPPLRLALGQDCIERMRTKMKQVESDIAQWEKASVATGYGG